MAKDKTAVKPQGEPARQQPVHRINFGRIQGAIWANETQAGRMYSVTIQRRYKDGDEWKSSDSFGREDLPLVAKVADMAHTWIYTEGRE